MTAGPSLSPRLGYALVFGTAALACFASLYRARAVDDLSTVAQYGRTVTAQELFDYGAALPSAEAGMAMPTVQTLAEVHGWRVEVDRSYDEGVRVVLSGASVSRADPAGVE